MSDVIFVGNGINRAFQGDSWQNIVENVVKEYSPPYTYNEIKELPFSMQIVAASKDNVNKAMKDIVTKSLAESRISDEQKAFLESLLSIQVKNIITANYSFELEQAAGITPKCYDYRKRRRYTMDLPKSTVRPRIDCFYDIEEFDKQIWHIHGDICKTSGVIMGHYYYEKLIKEIEDYIPNFMRRYNSFSGDKKDFRYHSWVDAFLVDDVYMFGFGMDFSESDIWWLICCKKRHFPNSRVCLYQPSEDLSGEQKIMLEAYNVNIMNIDFNGEYKEFYKAVVTDIADRIKGEK